MHTLLTVSVSRLSGVLVSVLATRPKVTRVQTWPRRWIFKGDTNLQHAFLLMGSKAAGPIS
jgi:hypothetical protein